MSSANGGILNRLENDLFNWETIEQVKIKSEVAIIYFKSGREEKINNPVLISAIEDFIKIFPDISDEFTRSKMRLQIHGIRADIPQQKNTSGIKTDIAPTPPKPSSKIIKDP